MRRRESKRRGVEVEVRFCRDVRQVSYSIEDEEDSQTHLATNVRPLQANLARSTSLRSLDILALQQLVDPVHSPRCTLLRQSSSLLIFRRLDLQHHVQTLLPAEGLDVVGEREAGEEGAFPA